VAPLLTARGTQNKVLEAVACGLPCVVSKVVAVGLPEEVLGACRVAGTPQEFAEAIISLLLMSPGERRTIVDRAAPSELSWDRSLSPLIDQLQLAVGASRQ
jgi:glycosyltransferase involved in cell wall biosynthesis